MAVITPINDPEYDIIGFIYSAIVFAGGVMGYVKKGSLASLLAGGGTGVLLGWGAYRVSHNPRDVRVTLGVALFLTLMMGQRFLRSGKFMPAGFVALLSLIMVARYGARVR